MSVESVVRFTWKYPLWHTHPGRVLKSGQIEVDGEIIQTYADNDGGAWYYDKNGRAVRIHGGEKCGTN